MRKWIASACVQFCLCSPLWAQPPEKITPQQMEWGAVHASLDSLKGMVKYDRALAVQVSKDLLARRPKGYKEQLDRQVALNMLARLLPDAALETYLKAQGLWVEDQRWGGANEREAAVDLGRTVRCLKEIELVGRLCDQGAYQAGLDHILEAMKHVPFGQRRGETYVLLNNRRKAVEQMLGTTEVGVANAHYIANLESIFKAPEDINEAAFSWLLAYTDSAEQSGLPMLARDSYEWLNREATRLPGKSFDQLTQYIAQTHIFYNQWMRDPRVAEQAPAEFGRLSPLIDKLQPSELDPYWAARLGQTLVLWREIVPGTAPWFDQKVAAWRERFHRAQLDFAVLRSQLRGVAQLRQQGQLDKAEAQLAGVEKTLKSMPAELVQWKETLGKAPYSQEVALLAMEAERERARLLMARNPNPERPALDAFFHYRAALGWAFRPRDVVELLNEEAPLVRVIEPTEFLKKNAQALKESQRFGDRLGMLQSYAELGFYQAAEGQKAAAVENLTRAVELFDKYVAELNPTGESRQALRERMRKIYDRLAQLKLEQGDASGAFQALTTRGQVEQSMSTVPLTSKDPATQKKLDEAERGRERVAAAANSKQASPELLAKNKSEFFALVRNLRSQGKNYGGLLAVQPVEFAQLQGHLPADALLVQYYPTADKLYFFVISRESFKVRSLALPKDKLYGLVRDFRKRCRAFTNQSGNAQFDWTSAEGRACLGNLRQLHQALIQPIQEDLSGRKVLAVIPTEALLMLPFSALARDQDGPPHFLVEDLAVVTILRASDLARLSGAPNNQVKTGLLALGNPDGTLVGAENEVKELGKTVPQASVLVRQEATLARLTQPQTPPGMLHLATHAVLDRRQPNSSYLVLAGQGEAGKLRVPQIFDLPLQGTRLVTLSACETDLGEAEPGAAVSSLAEAFWVAGSPSLIASLWSVEDHSTSQLMVKFYQSSQQGASLAESLRQAQLGLIKDKSTTHPFFWAPFVLIGNWQ